MLKIKKLSEMMGKKVFTDSGDVFGYVEEVNIMDNKIDGWRIVVSRDSGMSSLLGGARGIVIPHQFVKSIGDVILINQKAVPVREGDEEISLDEGESVN